MSDLQPNWFDDVPVIGHRPPAEAARMLRDIGETEVASRLEQPQEATIRSFGLGTTLQGMWNDAFGPCLWRYTAHAFGYIAPHAPGAAAPLPIHHAGNIAPDVSLRGQRVKITLNWLRVANYPGSGMHRVLFDFYARNQSRGPDADLHFNATYRVMEGQQAGIIGYPIFVGVNVGEQGLAFRCFTVNVRNDADEGFLDLLESDAFKQGLEVTKAVQPAIKPFAEMAYGLTRAVAKRNRNVPVQDVYMGLDFSEVPGRARLAEGAYIAVQVPDALSQIWNWQDWSYDPTNGNIVASDNITAPLPYNFLVLGISRVD
jgi:hypothetical protein